jgi:hypothetical protein
MKRMLADVLWEAANTYLCPDGKARGKYEPYSCAAVSMAFPGQPWSFPDSARRFLRSLGCDTDSLALLHPAFEFSPEAQGIRYMWLLLAMHAAEDEGIEV